MKITPEDARDLAESAIGSRAKAEMFLLTWLAAGEIRADAAVTIKPGGLTVRKKRLQKDVWASIKKSSTASLWDSAAITFKGENYIGIKFDEAQVKDIIKEHTSNSSPTLTPKKSNAGRNSGFHGDVIASITIDLLLLTDEEFVKEKLADIVKRLSSSYEAKKEIAPSARNLAAMAKGLVKIVGENRSKLGRKP
jgi:coenzyme F420-reducing hydrogenase alpha subunit